ncbi:AMP-binding protein [Paraburkholderia sp. Ac-20340]|uniref:AMP-binding protein n=1 Tax=Paraburkholderia sp. Ac-20340 TaxID=2703888 RepID=UPI00197EA41C|nr:AMP-binding protein [Paraburkholderia sp. Ac-20340]MBN3854485.1 AMP-binding protein [Paraburkholderia sp. Ac-20340]
MRVSLISREHPQRPAFIEQDGRALSYAGLHEAIDDWAADLAAGELVFVLGDNDLPTALCYLGAQRGGAVALLLARNIHEAQFARLMGVYRPSLVFMPVTATLPDGATLVREAGGYGLYRLPLAAASRPALHADLALLLATSGSTGSPRLVRLTMANLEANADSIAQYLGITCDERAITSLPMNYSYGLSVINSHLRVGASIVLSNGSLMDGGFWRQVNEQRVTSFAGVPFSYDMLLKLRLARMELPSVRTLTQAGGRLDPAKLAQVAEICRAKGIRFFPMYGQTEATARIAYLEPEEIAHKAGSIGRAIPGGRLWLESDDGRVLDAAGEVGELIYAGANVSMGYAGCADDLALGDVNRGVLRTGDLARIDEEGCFYIEGRRRRFLKIFGIRVSLDAVERIAADLGVVCAAHGADDKLVIHAEQTPQWNAPALRADLAQRIGVHPSAIAVNALTELPRLPTGKVDYPCLSQLS